MSDLRHIIESIGDRQRAVLEGLLDLIEALKAQVEALNERIEVLESAPPADDEDGDDPEPPPPPDDDEPDDPEPPPNDEDNDDEKPTPEGWPDIPEGAVIRYIEDGGHLGIPSGESADRPLILMSAYPDRRARRSRVRTISGGNHVWVWGIEAEYFRLRDVNGPIGDVRLIDCAFSGRGSDIQARNHGRGEVSLFRCSFNDSPSGGRASGLYVNGLESLIVTECIFDNNGQPDRDQFTHGLYIQDDVGAADVTGCIFSRNASHGLQHRTNGVTSNNVCWRNASAMIVGGRRAASGTTRAEHFRATHNLVMASDDISPDMRRGVGIEVMRAKQGLVADNICLDRASSNNRAGIQCRDDHEGDEPIEVTHNVARNWHRDGEPVDVAASAAEHYHVHDNRTLEGGPPLPDMEAIIDYHRTRPFKTRKQSESARALYDSVNKAIDR